MGKLYKIEVYYYNLLLENYEFKRVMKIIDLSQTYYYKHLPGLGFSYQWKLWDSSDLDNDEYFEIITNVDKENPNFDTYDYYYYSSNTMLGMEPGYRLITNSNLNDPNDYRQTNIKNKQWYILNLYKKDYLSPTTDNIVGDNKNIIDLAIQAYPGTKFTINGNSNPIIIGPSGIFQWKVLDNEGYINSILFVDFPFEMTEDQLKQIDMLVTYGYYED